MKKCIFMLVLVTIFGLHNTFAQEKVDVQKMATQLCECSEKSFAKAPKAMREMILEGVKVGSEKAKTNMEEKVKKMSKTEQGNFEKSMAVFEEEMKKNCGDVMSKYIGTIEQGNFNNSDMEKMLKFMKGSKNCKFGYAMILQSGS